MSDLDLNIYDFNELITDRNELKNYSLILGNGASIAVSDKFDYKSLFEKL